MGTVPEEDNVMEKKIRLEREEMGIKLLLKIRRGINMCRIGKK
jgi:hypothetical protein